MKLQLYLYKSKEAYHEILVTPFDHRIPLKLFGLANSLNAAVHKLVDEDIERIIDDFVRRVGFKELSLPNARQNDAVDQVADFLCKQDFDVMKNGRLEKPVPFTEMWPEGLTKTEAFIQEFMAIRDALEQWLLPTGRGRTGAKSGRKSPSQKFVSSWSDNFTSLDLDFNLNHLAKFIKKNSDTEDKMEVGIRYLNLHKCRKHRNTQFATEFVPISVNKANVPAEAISSEHGLLPLVWAEILYAVRNDIFSTPCVICEKWFPIPRGAVRSKSVGYQNFNSKYCSNECRTLGKKIADQKRNSRA